MGRTVSIDQASPFYFPSAGQLKMENGAAETLISGGDPIEMLNVSGRGVVREIQIIFESGVAVADIHDMYLNIAYDGEVTPSISVPVASLFAYETGTSGANIIASNFETPFFSVTTPPDADDGFNFSGILRYPIPFTNGIHIYLSAQNGIEDIIWWNVLYQNELENSWNNGLRLHIDRSSETLAGAASQSGTIGISGTAVTGSGTSFAGSMVGKYIIVGQTDYLITAVADTTHLTIATVDSTTVSAGQAWKLSAGHTWLSRAAGKEGWIASVIGGMDGGDFTFLEANTRIRLDGELQSSLAWSGTEDFFLGAFYWQFPDQNEQAGIVCFDGVAFTATAYRVFFDMPIRYTNGVKGVQPNTSANAVTHNWTVAYYEKI